MASPLHFKVLGSGCKKCSKTAEFIQQVASEQQIEVTVEKVTDPQAIMASGVMSTPGVLLNDQLVHSGSIPHRQAIEGWLKSGIA